MGSLTDKIAFITGASSGIGMAIAREFSKSGVNLVLAARRSERLKKLASELPTKALVVELDIRNRNKVESAISGLGSEWSQIDILVNNAGLGRGLEKIHEGNPDGWDEMTSSGGFRPLA